MSESNSMVLPVHPVTGLTALGFTSRGPVWPVLGASGDPDPAADPPAANPAPDPKPDEPLGDGGVKALKAEREARKTAETRANDLQTQLDAANQQLAAVKNDGLPEWQQQINDLQAKLDGEITARQKAEQTAQEATLAQLRTDRGIEKGLSAAAAKKLAPSLKATMAEEIDAEIDDWLPYLGGQPAGPAPNPQQGNPSQSRGGSLSAGRERYAAAHK